MSFIEIRKLSRSTQYLLVGIFIVNLVCIISCSEKEKGPQRNKIILDTDIGGDIDDLGALYALHVYADSGLCEIEAIMSSWAMAYHVDGIDAVNTYFGRPEISVGAHEDYFFEKEEYTWYLGEKFPHVKTGRTAEKATKLYRKILSENPDTSITIVVTGRLNNIYKLLHSEADSFSNLNGKDLITLKVKEFYIMGGNFYDSDSPEANFKWGGPGVTKYVLENVDAPIIFNGGEIGGSAYGYYTGAGMNQLRDENILKAGYSYFFKNPPDWTGREGQDDIAPWSIWDVISVQLAVTGINDYFTIVEDGYCVSDSAGQSYWLPGGDKDHSYVVAKMNPKVYSDEVIEPLFLTEAVARRDDME